MIKPEDIKNITFEQSVFSGYKKEDVDEFLDKLYDEVSRLYQENAELVQKLKVCVGKIEEYRQDEQFLKAAIVNAQKLNETAMKEIAVKKQQIEQAAREEANKIVSDAHAKAASLENEAEKRVSEFREKTTADFAEKYKKAETEFNAQKQAFADEIAKEQAIFDTLRNEVGKFKKAALSMYEQQVALIEKLPDQPVEKIEQTDEKADEPLPQEPAAEEVAHAQPEVIREESEKPQNVSDDFSVSDALEADTEEPVSDIAPADSEEKIDADAFAESLVETAVAEDLKTDRSPVEPEVSPLFFSSDIDEQADEPIYYDDSKKSKKRYKNLKFGIDFDVNSDK